MVIILLIIIRARSCAIGVRQRSTDDSSYYILHTDGQIIMPTTSWHKEKLQYILLL